MGWEVDCIRLIGSSLLLQVMRTAIHRISDGFEMLQDQTLHCGVSCH